MSQAPRATRLVPGMLQHVWIYPSFRDAVAQLVALDPASLDRLRELTARGFALPLSSAAQFRLSEDDFARMLAALRTLYDLAMDGGNPLAVIEDLEARIREVSSAEGLGALSSPSGKEGLLKLLDARPELELEQRRDRLSRLGGPSVEDLAVMVDLRPAGAGRDPWESMVPAVILRLFLDESVGGNASVAVHLTPEHLHKLLAELQRASEMLATMPPELRERML